MAHELHDTVPDGYMWWCPQCGRLSADRAGKLALTSGWTHECSTLALLIVFDSNTKMREDGRAMEAEIASPQPPPMPEADCDAAEKAHPKEVS